MDIINLSRAELSALMATTVQPTCVNMPEELIRYIPSYVLNRVRFVNCDESVCDITGLPMPRSLEEKRELSRDIDKAFVSLHGKSQMIRDWADRHTIKYFDCTAEGDDDE